MNAHYEYMRNLLGSLEIGFAPLLATESAAQSAHFFCASSEEFEL